MIDFQAYRKRCEKENQMAWLNGYYIKQALQSTILICGLADKKVINKMPKYPDMPLSKEETESEDYQSAKNKVLIAKMNKWQKLNNARFKK